MRNKCFQPAQQGCGTYEFIWSLANKEDGSGHCPVLPNSVTDGWLHRLGGWGLPAFSHSAALPLLASSVVMVKQHSEFINGWQLLGQLGAVKCPRYPTSIGSRVAIPTVPWLRPSLITIPQNKRGAFMSI